MHIFSEIYIELIFYCFQVKIQYIFLSLILEEWLGNHLCYLLVLRNKSIQQQYNNAYITGSKVQRDIVQYKYTFFQIIRIITIIIVHNNQESARKSDVLLICLVFIGKLYNFVLQLETDHFYSLLETEESCHIYFTRQKMV